MQFLTGTISPQTRDDLDVGTVFRVSSIKYDRLETHIVLVDGRFFMQPDTDEQTLWYELTTLKMGVTWSPSLERRTVQSSNEFLDTIQHVEAEEAIAEFERQLLLAEQEFHNQSSSALAARGRLLAFRVMQDRLGVL